MKYRIPIWLPMAGALSTLLAASTFTGLRLAAAFEDEALSRVDSQRLLIEHALTTAADAAQDSQSLHQFNPQSTAHGLFRTLPRGTAAILYKCAADYCSPVAKNSQAVTLMGSATNVNTIVNTTKETAHRPEKIKGVRYYFSVHEFSLMMRTKPDETFKVALIVNLDQVVAGPLVPFIQAKLIAACMLSAWLALAFQINVRPVSLLRRRILKNQVIQLPPWAPQPLEALASQMRLDRSALVLSLKEAEKLTQVVENVNHIAAHDIKADLTALVKGSEIIIETLQELQGYSAAIANADTPEDEVTLDAIETALHFAELNRNSASNAFDILDQRNKLHDLDSRIELAPHLLATLLEALSATFATESGFLRIANNCSDQQALLIDYSLLLGALKNIVRNGFIHNDSVIKTVSVTVAVVGDRVQITVTDNGTGMPETYLKNWGQILGKAAQLNTARGGSGIGLYSIRSIIEAHKKATVELKSIVGEGSTFILEFPQR